MDGKLVKAHFEKMAALIEKHGFTVMGVLSDGTAPGFAYTVGLSEKGLADVVVLGLDFGTAQQMLSAVAQRHMSKTLTDFNKVEEIATVALRLVGADDFGGQVMLSAKNRAIERGGVFTALQLIYPDEDGHFPDSPRCSARIVSIQNLEKLALMNQPRPDDGSRTLH